MSNKARTERPIGPQSSSPGAGEQVSTAVSSAFTTPDWRLCVFVIVAVTALTRASTYGNPLYSVDDQLYLMIGNAIVKGHIPYVEIWDRKPIGIFLIYALIAKIGGNPIITAWIVAGGFVAATTYVIMLIARYYTTKAAAIYACLIYPIALTMFKGSAGQSQLFYNLFIALAFVLFLRAVDQPYKSTERNAALASFLCGLALIIRQTTIIESLFVGIGFLAFSFSHTRSWRSTARLGFLMAAIGATPTLLTFATFYELGHFLIYFDSTYLSIFRKDSDGFGTVMGAIYALAFMAPVAMMAILGAFRRREEGPRTIYEKALLAWTIAALFEVLIIPRFYAYYSIPLLTPLIVSASTLFKKPVLRECFLGGMLVFAFGQGDISRFRENESSRTGFEQVVRYVRANLKGGCLFVADGPPLLYEASGQPCRTRYLFPDHLAIATEASAIGTDSNVEAKNILAQRPTVIVLQLHDYAMRRNPQTWPIVRNALATNYRLARRFRMPVENRPATLTVWLRNPD